MPDTTAQAAALAHEHDPVVAHQFDDVHQQRAAVTLGMWAFLATEVMFFGGLFLCYAVYRASYPEDFSAASAHLNIWVGAVNTLILLGSSYSMALAVHFSRVGDVKWLIRCLWFTIGLGTLFLVIKAFEYTHEFHLGLFPGRFFDYTTYTAGVELFFVGYFIMTGLHATHMIVGLGILATLVWMARRGRFTPQYNTPVDMSGLYWHFVDVVWIFLYPLLYLIH